MHTCNRTKTLKKTRFLNSPVYDSPRDMPHPTPDARDPSGARIVLDDVELIVNHHRATSTEDFDALQRSSSAKVASSTKHHHQPPSGTQTTSSSLFRTTSTDNPSSRTSWFDGLVRSLSSSARSSAPPPVEEETGTTQTQTTPTTAPEESEVRATKESLKKPSRWVDSDLEDEDDEDDEATPENERASSSSSWFNPEQFTAEKRRWLRDQRLSVDFDAATARLNLSGENADEARDAMRDLRTFESFLVCGLEPDVEVNVVADSVAAAREARLSGAAADVAITDPRKLRAYRGTAGNTYKASVLFRYPNASEEEPAFAVDEVAAFCFPHGVEPRLLERTPSMSKLQEMMYGTTFTDGDDHVFVFQVQTSDNTPMYGVCVYVTEVLKQTPPMIQHLRTRANGAAPTEIEASSLANNKSPVSLKNRYIQVAPRCYCMLSKLPLFQTHFEVLSHILGMERVERINQNMQDLMPDASPSDAQAPPTQSNEALNTLCKYLECQVPDIGETDREFIPSDGVKPIRLARPAPLETTTSPNAAATHPSCPSRVSAEEEAFHLQGWSIVSLCCSLSLDNIISLLTAVLLEKQVVVFSNNLGELSAVSLALIPLLRPFRWQSLFLPILPQHMVDFLDAPVPFVCGVQHKTSDLRARTSHLCRVNVYKDDIKLQWEGKALRLPKIKELVRKLVPHYEAIVHASVNHSKRPVLDPSEASIQAANKFLEEWRAYLHSLVANIRYHAITDVNEGGEGKVTILLKESFLASFEGRDKSFMRSFVETQMFATYADDRLASES